ncbi:cation diffusion facilitator family transporter [Paucilactobacillus nenjiangensis]|uniref:cation diffusion facilitator family transporter n=1 Tax=Paucilactobacillus nenjiangensis TaxID=1296540 RepID=UPI0028D71244|nr:cation diffusion facilitator family transporter [Paucilactobacillus nenjiangensis]
MDEEISGKRFLWVTVLNLIITIVEILGGLVSGSLALLSDAFHNLGDSLSILLGYFAQLIGKRPETERQTFGYRRAEILSAFLNALFLIIVSVFLLIEAVKRFSSPSTIDGPVMLVVAIVGLLANLVAALLLHKGSEGSLNIKATYLHVLSDSLSSVGVIVGALIVTIWHIDWVDPVLTIGVAVFICFEAWPIVKQTITILMQASPKLDYLAIQNDIVAIDDVISVHHIHAWMIDEHRIIFSAHINVLDLPISEVEPIYAEIELLLKEKYGIGHVTIQAEVARGLDEELFNTPGDTNTEN